MKKASLLAVAVACIFCCGCGGGAQTPEEAKADEAIQQSAPELQEGA